MSDSRIIQIRKSETAKLTDVQYPFMFIQEQFGYSLDSNSTQSILRPIHTIPQVHLGVYPDTFPHTIKEVFWTQEATPGSGMWIALGQLKGGLYFFYTAQCQNTQKTFLDSGHMNLWISVQFSDLIHFAMGSEIYTRYIDATATLKDQQI